MLPSFLSKKLFSSSLLNLLSNFKSYPSSFTSHNLLDSNKNEIIKAFMWEKSISSKMKVLYDKKNGEIMKDIVLDRLQVLQKKARKNLEEIEKDEQIQKDLTSNTQIEKNEGIASDSIDSHKNEEYLNKENLIFGTSSLFLDLLALLLLSAIKLNEKEFLVLEQINNFYNKYKEYSNKDEEAICLLRISFMEFIKTAGIILDTKKESFLFDRNISIIYEIFKKISKKLNGRELTIILDVLSKDQNHLVQEKRDNNEEIFNLWLKDNTTSFFKSGNEEENLALPLKKYEYLTKMVSLLAIKNECISLLYTNFLTKNSISNLSVLFQMLDRLVQTHHDINLEILSDHLENCFASIEKNRKRLSKEHIYEFVDVICKFCFLMSENITTNAVFEPTTIKFFKSIYFIMEKMLCLINLRITSEEECKIVFNTFNLFRTNRILSMNLLEKIENIISISNNKFKVHDFLSMLLFYVDSPIVVNGFRIKTQIDFFIQKNLETLNAETTISIVSALLQISFKPQSVKFDIYSMISNSTWAVLMDLIKKLDFRKLTKTESTKLFLFMKLMEFNSILKKDFFIQIGTELVSDYRKLDTRKISLAQKKLETILKKIYGENEVICEPELIEDIFSVDFAIKNKQLIFEMDGPKHFYAIVGESEENNLLESNSNHGNSEKQYELVERKTNLIKRGLLERSGWFIANITWRDLEMEEEKIKKYIENYIFMRDQEKARKMIGI